MCCSFIREVGIGLTEKMMFEQRCERDEGVNLANTWWKNTPGKGFLQSLRMVRDKRISRQSETARRKVRIEQTE